MGFDMHIPTGMIEGMVCPVTTIVSVSAIATAAVLASKQERQPSALRFAMVSAGIFAGQMLNYPVAAGASGHLLGGVLAAVLLGVPQAVLALACVVTLQCLVFADGGLAVLGANLLNMAVIGAGLGGWLHLRLAASLPNRPRLAAGLAAWMSVMLAALACTVELALSGSASFTAAAPVMLGLHAGIGVGEALLTMALVSLPAFALASTGKTKLAVPALLLAAAVVVAPFACPWPDGLESAALRVGFAGGTSSAAPLAGYSVAAISHVWLATWLAAAAGVIGVFLCALPLARIWQRRSGNA